MKLKKLVAALAVGLGSPVRRQRSAQAQFSGDVIRIGIITDMSSLYADIDGPAGVRSDPHGDRQDFGGKVAGQEHRAARPPTTRTRPTSPLQGARVVRHARPGHADRRHQLRHRPGHGQGRRREEEARSSSIGAGSARLTNEDCTPYTVHYAYDTVALAKVRGRRAWSRQGGKNWYFLTADYAFGHSLEGDTANGGRRPTAARWPARCAHR